jgi:hypothetical protein
MHTTDPTILELTEIAIPTRKAMQLINLSRPSFLEFAASNNVPIFHIGRIPYVRVETLQQVIKRLESEANK